MIDVQRMDFVALRVEDMGRAGAFYGETRDSSVCHMAFFTDPDGNDLMLHRRYAPST